MSGQPRGVDQSDRIVPIKIYLRDASLHAERLWSAVLEAGEPHQLMVIAPGHQRRIQAGILSWGQDRDHETVPFQCNLAYQVPRKKRGDYIGRAALERMRAEIEAGRPPFMRRWREALSTCSSTSPPGPGRAGGWLGFLAEAGGVLYNNR